MNKIIATTILLLAGQLCFAQIGEEVIEPYGRKADRDVETFVGEMIRKGKWDKEYDALKIEFTTDTMRIELTARLFGEDGHYTTADMHNTVLYQLAEYDKLLNKYYRLLMNKLSDEDREKFRESQRVWLSYRDSEKKVNREIVAPNKYTGSGTMWPLIAGGRNLDIVRERVCTLYELLTYF